MSDLKITYQVLEKKTVRTWPKKSGPRTGPKYFWARMFDPDQGTMVLITYRDEVSIML